MIKINIKFKTDIQRYICESTHIENNFLVLEGVKKYDEFISSISFNLNEIINFSQSIIEENYKVY